MKLLGWFGIIAGILLCWAAFWLFAFMAALNGGQNVVHLSAGRWDDYLAFLALCVGGGWAIWRGDKLAGSPIWQRVKTGGSDHNTRNLGCLVFGAGIGAMALVLFMIGGTVLNAEPLLAGAIISLWLIPLGLIVRGGWRRFSGRGWLWGERPWF